MTWQEIYDAVPVKESGIKDESALADAFQKFIGGPSRQYQLQRIFGKSVAASGKSRLKKKKEDRVDLEMHFLKSAMREGFTEEEVQAYIVYQRES